MLAKLQMPSVLKGEITLRRKTLDDTDALWDILNKHRESIGKYLNSPHKITSRQAMIDSIASDMDLWDKGE